MGSSKPRWDWLKEKTGASELLREGPSAGVDYGRKVVYPGLFGAELVNTPGEADTDAAASTHGRISRPEHGIFSLAMVGGRRVFGQAHIHGEGPQRVQRPNVELLHSPGESV